MRAGHYFKREAYSQAGTHGKGGQRRPPLAAAPAAAVVKETATALETEKQQRETHRGIVAWVSPQKVRQQRSILRFDSPLELTDVVHRVQAGGNAPVDAEQALVRGGKRKRVPNKGFSVRI